MLLNHGRQWGGGGGGTGSPTNFQGGGTQYAMPPPPPPDFGVVWLLIEMRTLFSCELSGAVWTVLVFVFACFLVIEVGDVRIYPYPACLESWRKVFKKEKKCRILPPPPRLSRLAADRKKKRVSPPPPPPPHGLVRIDAYIMFPT